MTVTKERAEHRTNQQIAKTAITLWLTTHCWW